MLRGEIAISRKALDDQDVGQATAYLRSWLVAPAILDARGEPFCPPPTWVPPSGEDGRDRLRAHAAAERGLLLPCN